MFFLFVLVTLRGSGFFVVKMQVCRNVGGSNEVISGMKLKSPYMLIAIAFFVFSKCFNKIFYLIRFAAL